MPAAPRPLDEKDGLHWSQYAHLVLLLGAGVLALTFGLMDGSDPRFVLALSGVLTLAFWGIVRLVYPRRLRRRHIDVRRMVPDSTVFVSWAISDRALFAKARYSDLGKGWAVIGVAPTGLSAWKKGRSREPTYAFGPETIGFFALANERHGPIIAFAPDGHEPTFALFPLCYQAGEYFQARGQDLHAMLEVLNEGR